MYIRDLFKNKKRTFSFEFFPPKDEISAVEFGINVGQLIKLNPSFVSVTYGAGGSTQERTFNIVDYFQNKLGLLTMAHYTCVNASHEKVEADLQYLYERNIHNLMLLRGDPPKGSSKFIASSGDFSHATDLIKLAKSQNRFSIGAACYPEKHVEANTLDEDITHVKEKANIGADYFLTQMFFNNTFYFNYVKMLNDQNVFQQVIPGIIPITNVKQIQKFAELSNTFIPNDLKDNLMRNENNETKVYQIGLDFAIKQCRELLDKGAPGIHFYTLNKSRATIEIYESLMHSKHI